MSEESPAATTLVMASPRVSTSIMDDGRRRVTWPPPSGRGANANVISAWVASSMLLLNERAIVSVPVRSPMTQVKLFSKYQIVIPEDVREQLEVKPASASRRSSWTAGWWSPCRLVRSRRASVCSPASTRPCSPGRTGCDRRRLVRVGRALRGRPSRAVLRWTRLSSGAFGQRWLGFTAAPQGLGGRRDGNDDSSL